ncbi:MAG: hypothetical protein G8237_13240 [Magnetococcales bacterium]|nr:hypothetical protein [Magnetococcales bacterium]NGZ07307.1 hypothetical protein [Magnetococcales bacterium]
MPELLFRVQGNNNRPVEVTIKKNGKNLTSTCTCSSGVDDICQHRINILSGSDKEIISNNADEIKKISSWIAGTDVGKAMHDMIESLKMLENAKDDFNNARKRLIKALKD